MLYIEYNTVSVALSGDGSLIPNDSTIIFLIIDHFWLEINAPGMHTIWKCLRILSKITFAGKFVAIGRLLKVTGYQN